MDFIIYCLRTDIFCAHLAVPQIILSLKYGRMDRRTTCAKIMIPTGSGLWVGRVDQYIICNLQMTYEGLYYLFLNSY